MIFLQFLCPNYEYYIACYYRWLVNLYKHLFVYLHYHNQWLGTQEASNMLYFFHAVDLWFCRPVVHLLWLVVLSLLDYGSLVDIIVPYSHCCLLVIFSFWMWKLESESIPLQYLFSSPFMAVIYTMWLIITSSLSYLLALGEVLRTSIVLWF